MKCWTRWKKDGSKYVTCDTKASAKAKPKAKAKAKKPVERVVKKAKTQVTKTQAKPKAKATKTQAKPKAKAKSYADRVDDVVRAAQKVAMKDKVFKMRNRMRALSHPQGDQ